MTMNTLPSILIAGVIGAIALPVIGSIVQDVNTLSLGTPSLAFVENNAVLGFLVGASIQVVLRLTKIS